MNDDDSSSSCFCMNEEGSFVPKRPGRKTKLLNDDCLKSSFGFLHESVFAFLENKVSLPLTVKLIDL